MNHKCSSFTGVSWNTFKAEMQFCWNNRWIKWPPWTPLTNIVVTILLMMLLCFAKLFLKFAEYLESNTIGFVKLEIYNHEYEINLYQKLILRRHLREPIWYFQVKQHSLILFCCCRYVLIFYISCCVLHCSCWFLYCLL